MLGINNKKVAVTLITFLLPAVGLLAQYNTYVSSPSISPSPLQAVESNGTGVLRFDTGNSGSDTLFPIVDGVTMTISLSNGVPDTDDPLDALGGSAASYYSWEYDGGTYTGTLSTFMPGEFSGNISIDYRVTANSTQSNPQNGFSVSIDPGLFTNGNPSSDDQTSDYTWTECEVPAAPQTGTITQPTCAENTGSVVVSGLPSPGMWTLTVSPGDRTIEGTGTSITVSNLAPGSYTFRVTGTSGCISPPSSPVTINDAPLVPADPVVNVDCFLGNRFAVVTVVNPANSDFEYRLDNGPYQSSRTFLGVDNGVHTISIRSSGGCVTEGDPFSVECGCVNGPAVTLGSRSGSVCGTEAETVSGSFSGSATSVTITENGNGSLSQSEITSSPFTFTYTPAASDAGRDITITVTTNNPLGDPCQPAEVTYVLSVNAIPDAPVPGTITHPTCTSSTGSVVISGLPSSGTWTLRRNPGNVATQGNGTLATISGIQAGTFTFTVSSGGCTSEASASVVINPQPPTPTRPVAGTIVHPTCTLSTGTINLTGLPATGTWTLTRNPGSVTSTGTGETTSISGLPAGIYTFIVTNASGCTSDVSNNITINPQPVTPSPPVPGAITAPTCPQPFGSVVLTNLPASGRWTLTSIPAGVNLSGTGETVTVRNLDPGSYTFMVSSAAGCSSDASNDVLIPAIPDAPIMTVADPAPVCAPSTVDITAPSITPGLASDLTLTYWTNANATNEYSTPAAATNGTYYIKATNPGQCFVVQAVNVTVLPVPIASAGEDQVLNFQFSANISATVPSPVETGSWSIYQGTGVFENPSAPATMVSELGLGENIVLWKVTNNVCPEVVDTLRITVNDLIVPTLITPNEDGRNDYFILQGIEFIPGNELTIFDRRGVMVFRDSDYMNDWNGLDYNGKPLTEDTYFFVLRIGSIQQRSGYIVIRR